jgi:hypothetical protein
MDECTGLQHGLLAVLPRQGYHEVVETEGSTKLVSAECQYSDSRR